MDSLLSTLYIHLNITGIPPEKMFKKKKGKVTIINFFISKLSIQECNKAIKRFHSNVNLQRLMFMTFFQTRDYLQNIKLM